MSQQGKPFELPRERIDDKSEMNDPLLQDKINERKKKQIDRQDEIDQAEHEAKKAKLAKEQATAESIVEKVQGAGQDSGVKVTGEVSMGKIDYQEMQKDAKEEAEKLRTQQQTEIDTLGKANEQLRHDIHEQEMKAITAGFMAQVETSEKRIQDLIAASAAKGDVVAEFKRMKTMAEEFGLVNPQGAGDLVSRIELKKLDFEQDLRLQEVKDEGIERDRKWLLEKEKMEEEREARREARDAEKRKGDILAGLPEAIGTAVARGYMATPATNNSSQRTVESSAKKADPEKRYTLEAGKGESGEAPCPNQECDGVLAVGSTARQAICANCGTKVSIRRVEESSEVPTK